MTARSFLEFYESVKGRRQNTAAPMPVQGSDVLSVTQLTTRIDQAIKGSLPASLAVKGEVSNFKLNAGSGHAYFTLKDTNSCIDCVMFRSDVERLKFTPEDGMELLARGRVEVYAQRGRYQLYATSIHPLGQGALELAFQQLRAKLDAQGLFNPARKKPLPIYPRRIVMVTSRSTAALQDMLKVFRRFPALRLYLYHVPVQGEGSGEKIAQALAHINRCRQDIGVEVIILARGGGSLEDLWAFNEEAVARAVCASEIPVVTGIGHEVDVSIADLVADYHAHTPTEAAQVVAGHWRTCGQNIDALLARLRREMGRRLEQGNWRFVNIERHEFFRRPLDVVQQRRQSLDDARGSMATALSQRLRVFQRRVQEAAIRLERRSPAAVAAAWRQRLGQKELRLARGMSALLGVWRQKMLAGAAALGESHPRHALGLARQKVAMLSGRMERAMQEGGRRRLARLAALEAQLTALSPQRVLERGYTVTLLKKTQSVARGAAAVRPGDRLLTRFADGTVESVVEDGKQFRLFEE